MTALKNLHTPTLLLLFFLAAITAGCRGQENTREKTMPQHSIDRPEISKILFHPRAERRTPPPAGAIDLDITVADEVTIGCRLFSAGTEAPVILFFHGNGEIVADYDTLGPYYQQLDMNFLVTDYRGYGWSTGTPSAGTMLEDARLLFTKLRDRLRAEGYTGSFFLMGRSLGSACAIDLAARHNDEIAGLIIESGFGETLPLARTLGIDVDRMGITEEETFNNTAKMESITRPTFILHGQQDQLIPIWQAEKLMAAGGARSKELQVIPGADHNSLIAVGGMLYFQAIKQFIDKVEGNDDWRRRRRAVKKRQQES